jgi:hypothetical protein
MNKHFSVEKQVVDRIYGRGRGNVFTPIDFADLGSDDSVDLSLRQLTRRGVIRRLRRGLYDYPKTHAEIGILSPQPEKVAEALARKAGLRLQPTGALAANMLGLSEQVPARVVFLTDGAGRKVSIGRLVIELRKAAPRHLALAGQMNGTVIQALRHLGKAHITPARIATLRRVLKAEDRRRLPRDARFAPAWMRPHLLAVAEGLRHA